MTPLTGNFAPNSDASWLDPDSSHESPSAGSGIARKVLQGVGVLLGGYLVFKAAQGLWCGISAGLRDKEFYQRHLKTLEEFNSKMSDLSGRIRELERSVLPEKGSSEVGTPDAPAEELAEEMTEFTKALSKAVLGIRSEKDLDPSYRKDLLSQVTPIVGRQKRLSRRVSELRNREQVRRAAPRSASASSFGSQTESSSSSDDSLISPILTGRFFATADSALLHKCFLSDSE